MRLLLCVLALLSLPAMLLGADASAWGVPAGVGPYYCSPLVAPGYEWAEREDGWRYLRHGGKLVGAYQPARNVWVLYDQTDGAWAKYEVQDPWGQYPRARPRSTVSNVPPPGSKLPTGVVPAPADPAWVTHGVERDQLHAGACSINGWPVSQDVARRAIAEGKLIDDRNKWRVTVIGSEEERKRVLTDWDSAQELQPWRERALLQAYDTNWWDAAKFKARGKPTIICQAPDGQEVHRQDTYRGPALLAKALLASYDPNKTPDRSAPSIGGFLSWKVLVGAGLGLVVLLAIAAFIVAVAVRGRSAVAAPPAIPPVMAYQPQPKQSSPSPGVPPHPLGQALKAWQDVYDQRARDVRQMDADHEATGGLLRGMLLPKVGAAAPPAAQAPAPATAP